VHLLIIFFLFLAASISHTFPGKSTLAAKVVQRLNALANPSPNDPQVAAFIPMDGYHLTRAQLSALPDPATAHARRGAAFTFDGSSFLSLVKLIREPLSASSKPLYAPSFDHAVKDPKENDIAILPTMRILIFEGNYLSLNKSPWKEAAALMDELWFVEVDFEVAKRRLVPRHVEAGIASDEEEAERRVVENDLVNGEEIVENRLECTEVIVSRDEKQTPDSQK
jgi:pantothenate kinase